MTKTWIQKKSPAASLLPNRNIAEIAFLSQTTFIKISYDL